MNQREKNECLFDIVDRIWMAYRKSSESGDATNFNEVFTPLYELYEEPEFREFICQFGGALAPFVNKACATCYGEK